MRAWPLFLLACAVSSCTVDRSDRLNSIGDRLAQQAIAGTITDLADSPSFPDVVRVGPTLPDALARMQGELEDGYTVETRSDDCAGEDGDVTHSIIIRTKQDHLCLRLRYDASLDRFHIVGYLRGD